MRGLSARTVVAMVMLGWAHLAAAQSVEEVIDRNLAAMGGRAALGKLKTRSVSGTITLSTPAGDISGSVEIQNAVPNKLRSVIKADLSALGAGELVVDQRFDGNAGYVMDSLQGDREITGNQLDNLRNGSFPNAFLDYKEKGSAVRLGGRETIAGREAYVVILEPTRGSVVRLYIDAESYLTTRMVVRVDVPQIGQEVEQTTVFSDYREVDGVKVPFRVEATSSVQNYTIVIANVQHNVPINDALFSKPARLIVGIASRSPRGARWSP